MVLDAERVEIRDISDRYLLWQMAECSQSSQDCSYYLYNAGTRRNRPPQLTECKAIVFSSPDNMNYIDFWKNQKPQVLRFYMPVCSLDELRLLPNPKGIDIDEKFSLFGGIPRYVFKTQSYYARDLDLEILQSDVSNVCKFVGLCDVGNNSPKIFQYVVDTTSYIQSFKRMVCIAVRCEQILPAIGRAKYA